MTDDAKKVERLAPRELPAEHRGLLDAHDRFLREAYAFLASTQESLTSIGRVMPYVLLVRLLQHSRALHVLLVAGYPEEAEIIARAMTITATSLIAIVDADSDARALQFVAQSRIQRRRKIDGYIRQEMIDQDDANAWHEKLVAGEDEVLAGYAEHGIVPSRIGKGHMFWHGMRESDLFRKMTAERWLDLFYGPFSEEVHGTVESCADAIRKLTRDQLVRLGPTFNDPRIVVGASFETIAQALVQIDTHYALGRRAEAEAIGKRMKDAIADHAQRIDKNARTRLMPTLAQDDESETEPEEGVE